MNFKSSTIDLTDYLSLLTVWELEDGYWQLITITRMTRAIALVQESPTTRLVFPTGVFPNGVWGGVYEHRATKTSSKKVDTLQERRGRVLQLLYKSPGQTRDAIANQLGISVATAGQLLRSLEKNGDIHHRPHPIKNQVKLYYAADSAPTTSTGTSANPRNAMPSVRREPPLKIYFVAPRSLQRSK
ncbi:MAG: winged helix-turn-helix domain-containing protein [Gloeocapsa sp. UFS-A4-WI-NPMV-4B04]|jgi:DNA-binding CsgD family transcriptional regulator|nr:winged helix-turn-helix domain-containing protein [Gloeocapsa sp. UFS-A4-WI-NPMV-4B04]